MPDQIPQHIKDQVNAAEAQLKASLAQVYEFSQQAEAAIKGGMMMSDPQTVGERLFSFPETYGPLREDAALHMDQLQDAFVEMDRAHCQAIAAAQVAQMHTDQTNTNTIRRGR